VSGTSPGAAHTSGWQSHDVPMEIVRRVVVFDAADLAPESAFWAGMLRGRVIPDQRWHSVFDSDGRWVIGVQLAPEHEPPEWPNGNAQQIHLDLHVTDPSQAHDEAIALGARLLQAADNLRAAEGHQVYADPAGHPFCIGWGHPDDDTVRRYLRDHPA
jgi:Glyoxalase-like domain